MIVMICKPLCFDEKTCIIFWILSTRQAETFKMSSLLFFYGIYVMFRLNLYNKFMNIEP